MTSSFTDSAAIVQIIGCVFNNAAILDETDKYVIKENDFVEPFHQILFGSIYNIHLTGSQVNLDAIVDYLSNRPKFEAVFKQNKGEEYILEASQVAQQETFNYYYNRLKKMSLLRAYDSAGVNVRNLYDPDNILDTKKRQEQETWLDATPLQGITQAIDRRIEDIKLEYLDDSLGFGWQAGDGIDELLERLKKRPEVGIPMYGALINTVTKGARLRKYYLRSAATGVGKAIPNDTTIPTPQGNRLVKDIQVGDYLFGDDGIPTKVLAVYPQEQKKQVYIVEFSDGRQARCCEDHLWEYSFESHRGYASRVESVKEILARTAKLKNGFKDSCNKGFRFRVKLNEALQYGEKSLPIDPYVLGLFLGDGSFRQHPNNKTLQFSSQDDELPTAIAEIMGWEFKKNSDTNYTYYFKNQGQNVWVEHVIKDELAPLFNVYSQDKYIPRIYLEGSIEQRYALLQGLMDTDGSIDEKGRTSFTNSSRQLIADMVELCRGLGFITTVAEDPRSEKYTDSCFKVHIQCKKDNKVNLFRLKRKVQRATNYAATKKRDEHKNYIAITNIYPIDEYVDMTCFTVDNSSHLFLMNDCIVTHNTRSMVADTCNFACNRIYHEQFGWINNGAGQPTLYIGTEQEKDEIQTMMLAFVSNVTEDHIIDSYKATDEEKERVRAAAAIIKQSPLWFEWLPDFSLKDVENVIKKHIREHEVKYVLFDYIKTSPKILQEISQRSGGIRLREDNVLFMLSSRLKDIANEYGVFVESATQLNESWKNDDIPDQNLLRGAKSIADVCDVGMILLKATPEDLAKLEPILGSNPNFVPPTHKLSIYKNRRGQYTGCYLWCTANLGTCRVDPEFCTDWHHTLLSIEDVKIVIDEGPAAWDIN